MYKWELVYGGSSLSNEIPGHEEDQLFIYHGMFNSDSYLLWKSGEAPFLLSGYDLADGLYPELGVALKNYETGEDMYNGMFKVEVAYHDPESKAYVVRAIHSAQSLLRRKTFYSKTFATPLYSNRAIEALVGEDITITNEDWGHTYEEVIGSPNTTLMDAVHQIALDNGLEYSFGGGGMFLVDRIIIVPHRVKASQEDFLLRFPEAGGDGYLFHYMGEPLPLDVGMVLEDEQYGNSRVAWFIHRVKGDSVTTEALTTSKLVLTPRKFQTITYKYMRYEDVHKFREMAPIVVAGAKLQDERTVTSSYFPHPITANPDKQHQDSPMVTKAIRTSPYAGNGVGLQFPHHDDFEQNLLLQRGKTHGDGKVTSFSGNAFWKDTDTVPVKGAKDFRLTLPGGANLFCSNGEWILEGGGITIQGATSEGGTKPSSGSATTFLEIDQSGQIKLYATSSVELGGAGALPLTDNTHIHPTPVGPSGPPSAGFTVIVKGK